MEVKYFLNKMLKVELHIIFTMQSVLNLKCDWDSCFTNERLLIKAAVHLSQKRILDV